MRKFIFIWFLSVGIISGISAVWIGRSMRLAAGNLYESDFVRYSAETAARALDRGGPNALDEVERRIDPEHRLRFFAFDSDLHEISRRAGPEAVRVFAVGLQPQNKAQFQVLAGRLLAGSVIPAQNGRAYRIVIRFPARRVADVPLNVWTWSGRIGAIVLTASLLCSWLAWRLSAPVTHLRQAARRFASGDLRARAGIAAFPSSLPEYRELARDFDEMAARIETLVDSQRRLLRDISHELRTPLTRLNLAVNNARHAAGPEMDQPLDRIDQESERLNALIDRILRLSRFEAFAEPPHRDAIELADFIESIVSDADFEASAGKRHVSILRAETCHLNGDRELLREALENIVRNGIRYTPEGTAVTVDAYRAGQSEYRIVVRDCGPGVPGEHLAAIFEPFYRAPQCADTPGFGIGLAIAKRAIELHHGRIAARNLDGQGLEVAIHLPATAAM